ARRSDEAAPRGAALPAARRVPRPASRPQSARALPRAARSGGPRGAAPGARAQRGTAHRSGIVPRRGPEYPGPQGETAEGPRPDLRAHVPLVSTAECGQGAVLPMMQPLVHILTTGLLLLAQPVRGLDDGLGEVPEDVDRSSPLATVQGFQTAAHHSDYAQAAYYLALDWIPRDKQKTEGPRLARRLRFVLDRKLFLELGAISKEPQGDPAKPGYDQLGSIPLEKQNVPIRVSKYEVEGKPTWVFSSITVKSIDALYDAYGPPLAEVLPEVLFPRAGGGLELWQGVGLILAFAGALFGGWILERIGLAVLGRIARMTRVSWDDQLVHASRGPLRLPIWAVILSIVTPPL